MKILDNIITKITSWILVTSFLTVFVLNDYAYARIEIETSDEIDVPFECGQVVERFNAGDKYPMVILIQDLHANFEVQKNISGILEHIDTNYGISKIGLEGSPSDKKIDFSIVSSIPNASRKEESVDFFMKNGLIKGAEGFAALKKNSPPVYGIEDSELYDKNRDVLLSSLNNREQVVEYLQRIKYLLKMVEDRVFSNDLKKFRSHYILYKQRNLSPHVFLKYLKEWADRTGKSINSISTEYAKFMKLTENRHDLDDEKIVKEYDNLMKTLNYLDYEKDSGDTGTVRIMKHMSSTPTSRREKIYEKARLDRNYSTLAGFFDNIELSKQINTNKLLTEEDKVIKTVCSGLCGNQAEKDLVYVLDYVQTLIKFLLNQITREELDVFYEGADEFERSYNALMFKNNEEMGGIDDLLSALKPYIEEMGVFYSMACERDVRFVDNFVIKRSRRDKNIVMVTGGFHSEGVARHLKEKAINYTIVAPRVTSHDETVTKRYYQLMRGDTVLSYEDVLPQTLALISFFLGQDWFLDRIVIREIGKAMRDQLKQSGFNVTLLDRVMAFGREWSKGYISLKTAGEKYNFYPEDKVFQDGYAYTYMNLAGKLVMLGINRSGKIKIVPEEEAKAIIHKARWNRVAAGINTLKNNPYKLSLRIKNFLNVKKAITGLYPMAQVSSEKGQVDIAAFNGWLESLNRQMIGVLKLVSVGNTHFVYNTEETLKKLKNSYLLREDADMFEKDLDGYLRSLIENNDWRIKALEGYTEKEVVDARGGISISMARDSRNRIQAQHTQGEGRGLPDVPNEQEHEQFARLVSGKEVAGITAEPETAAETTRRPKARLGVSGLINKYRYAIAIGGVSIAAVIAAILSGPMVAGSIAILGAVSLFFIWQNDQKTAMIPAAAREEAVTEEAEAPKQVSEKEYTDRLNKLVMELETLSKNAGYMNGMGQAWNALRTSKQLNEREKVLEERFNDLMELLREIPAGTADNTVASVRSKLEPSVASAEEAAVVPKAVVNELDRIRKALGDAGISKSVIESIINDIYQAARMQGKYENAGQFIKKLEEIFAGIAAAEEFVKMPARIRQAIIEEYLKNPVDLNVPLEKFLEPVRQWNKSNINGYLAQLDRIMNDIKVEKELAGKLDNKGLKQKMKAQVIQALKGRTVTSYNELERILKRIGVGKKPISAISGELGLIKNPENPAGILLNEGDAFLENDDNLYARKKYEEAIQLADQVADKNLKNALKQRAHLGSGRSWEKQGNTEAALGQYNLAEQNGLATAGLYGNINRILDINEKNSTDEKATSEAELKKAEEELEKVQAIEDGLNKDSIQLYIMYWRAKNSPILSAQDKRGTLEYAKAQTELDNIIGAIKKNAKKRNFDKAVQILDAEYKKAVENEEAKRKLLFDIDRIKNTISLNEEKLQALRETRTKTEEALAKVPIDEADLENRPDVFFKSAAMRTTPLRFGNSYRDIVAEFDALKAMHKMFPEHIAEPLAFKYGENGQVEGYYMKKAAGVPLGEYDKPLSKELLNRLKEVIIAMHKAGIVHGDFHEDNIYITEDGSNFMILDPVGYPLPGGKAHEGFMKSTFKKAVNDRDYGDLAGLNRILVRAGEKPVPVETIEVAKAEKAPKAVLTQTQIDNLTTVNAVLEQAEQALENDDLAAARKNFNLARNMVPNIRRMDQARDEVIGALSRLSRMRDQLTQKTVGVYKAKAEPKSDQFEKNIRAALPKSLKRTVKDDVVNALIGATPDQVSSFEKLNGLLSPIKGAGPKTIDAVAKALQLVKPSAEEILSETPDEEIISQLDEIPEEVRDLRVTEAAREAGKPVRSVGDALETTVGEMIDAYKTGGMQGVKELAEKAAGGVVIPGTAVLKKALELNRIPDNHPLKKIFENILNDTGKARQFDNSPASRLHMFLSELNTEDDMSLDALINALTSLDDSPDLSTLINNVRINDISLSQGMFKELEDYKGTLLSKKPDGDIDDIDNAMKTMGRRTGEEEKKLDGLIKNNQSRWMRESKGTPESSDRITVGHEGSQRTFSVTIRVISDRNLPEGIESLRFTGVDAESNRKVLVVVTRAPPESDIAQEAVFHEKQEAAWTAYLMKEAGLKGAKEIIHQSHILASADQVIKYGGINSLTPFHQQQVDDMQISQLQAIISEKPQDRQKHHDLVKQYLGEAAFNMVADYEDYVQAVINAKVKIVRPKPLAGMSTVDKVRRIAEGDEFSPESLLNALKEAFPEVESLYSEQVTWDNTLERHTLMLLGQFEKYFRGMEFPAGVDTGLFRLILALHDIGKPKALVEGTDEHEETARMMREMLGKLGYSSSQIAVAENLIDGESIGIVLKDSGKIDRAASIIRRGAQKAGIAAAAYFELSAIFFMCDAGSYTMDAGATEKGADDLFSFNPKEGRMWFSDITSINFRELESVIKDGSEIRLEEKLLEALVSGKTGKPAKKAKIISREMVSLPDMDRIQYNSILEYHIEESQKATSINENMEKWARNMPKDFDQLLEMFQETGNINALQALSQMMKGDGSRFKAYMDMMNSMLPKIKYIIAMKQQLGLDLASMFKAEWSAAVPGINGVTGGIVTMDTEQLIENLFFRTINDPLFRVLRYTSKQLAGKDILKNLRDDIYAEKIVNSPRDVPTIYRVMTREEFEIAKRLVQKNENRGITNEQSCFSGTPLRNKVIARYGQQDMLLVRIKGSGVYFHKGAEEKEVLIFHVEQIEEEQVLDDADVARAVEIDDKEVFAARAPISGLPPVPVGASVGALKRIGVRTAEDAAKLTQARAMEKEWAERASGVEKRVIKGEEITARLLVVDDNELPEGYWAHNFRDSSGNLVIVTGSRYQDESIFHESREAFWMEQLKGSGETPEDIQQIAHILASAEQVLRFGFTPGSAVPVITPNHVAQLNDPAMTQDMLKSIIGETDRSFQHGMISRYLTKIHGKDVLSRINAYESLVKITAHEKIINTQVDAFGFRYAPTPDNPQYNTIFNAEGEELAEIRFSETEDTFEVSDLFGYFAYQAPGKARLASIIRNYIRSLISLASDRGKSRFKAVKVVGTEIPRVLRIAVSDGLLKNVIVKDSKIGEIPLAEYLRSEEYKQTVENKTLFLEEISGDIVSERVAQLKAAAEKAVSILAEERLTSYSIVDGAHELHLNSEERDGKTIYQSGLVFNTEMIFGSLEKDEAIGSGGFMSCTGIVIQGRNRDTGKTEYAVAHVYPDNFGTDIAEVMNRLDNISIEKIGIFPTNESRGEDDGNYKQNNESVRTLLFELAKYGRAGNIKGVYVRRGNTAIKTLDVTVSEIILREAGFIKYKILSWDDDALWNSGLIMDIVNVPRTPAEMFETDRSIEREAQPVREIASAYETIEKTALKTPSAVPEKPTAGSRISRILNSFGSIFMANFAASSIIAALLTSDLVLAIRTLYYKGLLSQPWEIYDTTIRGSDMFNVGLPLLMGSIVAVLSILTVTLLGRRFNGIISGVGKWGAPTLITAMLLIGPMKLLANPGLYFDTVSKGDSQVTVIDATVSEKMRLENIVNNFPEEYTSDLRSILYVPRLQKVDANGNIVEDNGIHIPVHIHQIIRSLSARDLGSKDEFYECTIRHEIGHNVFWNVLTDTQKQAWIELSGRSKDMNDFVSNYAKTNYNEDFAETFMYFTTEPLGFASMAIGSDILLEKLMLMANLMIKDGVLKVYDRNGNFKEAKVSLVDGKLTSENLFEALTGVFYDEEMEGTERIDSKEVAHLEVEAGRTEAKASADVSAVSGRVVNLSDSPDTFTIDNTKPTYILVHGASDYTPETMKHIVDTARALGVNIVEFSYYWLNPIDDISGKFNRELAAFIESKGIENVTIVLHSYGTNVIRNAVLNDESGLYRNASVVELTPTIGGNESAANTSGGFRQALMKIISALGFRDYSNVSAVQDYNGTIQTRLFSKEAVSEFAGKIAGLKQVFIRGDSFNPDANSDARYQQLFNNGLGDNVVYLAPTTDDPHMEVLERDDVMNTIFKGITPTARIGSILNQITAPLGYNELMATRPELVGLTNGMTKPEYEKLQADKEIQKAMKEIVEFMYSVDPERAQELLGHAKHFVILDIPFQAMAFYEAGIIIIGKNHLENIRQDRSFAANVILVLAHEAKHIEDYNIGIMGDHSTLRVRAMEEERAYIETVTWMKKLAALGYGTQEEVDVQQFVTDHIKDNNYTGIVARMVTVDPSEDPETVVMKVIALADAAGYLAEIMGVSVDDLEFAAARVCTGGQPGEGMKLITSAVIFTEFTSKGVLHFATITKDGDVTVSTEQVGILEHVSRILDEDYSFENRQIFINSLIELAKTDKNAFGLLDNVRSGLTGIMDKLRGLNDEDSRYEYNAAERLLGILNEAMSEIRNALAPGEWSDAGAVGVISGIITALRRRREEEEKEPVTPDNEMRAFLSELGIEDKYHKDILANYKNINELRERAHIIQDIIDALQSATGIPDFTLSEWGQSSLQSTLLRRNDILSSGIQKGFEPAVFLNTMLLDLPNLTEPEIAGIRYLSSLLDVTRLRYNWKKGNNKWTFQAGINRGHDKAYRMENAMEIPDFLAVQEDLLSEDGTNLIPVIMNMIFDHVFDMNAGNIFGPIDFKAEKGSPDSRPAFFMFNETMYRDGDGNIVTDEYGRVRGRWPRRDPRITLIVTSEQRAILEPLIAEMFLGPVELREGKPFGVHHIVDFMVLDEGDIANLGRNVSITMHDGKVEVNEKTFDLSDNRPFDYDLGEWEAEPVSMPDKGMIAVPIGVGSFGRTTGAALNTSMYVAIRNADGSLTKILIDPHAEADRVLQARGLPTDVDYIIISHNHPDHIEGMLSGAQRGVQVIVEQGMVRKSMETILEQASKKSKLMTGQDLRKNVIFAEMNEDGKTIELPGGTKVILQMVEHSIPTAAIRIEAPKNVGGGVFVMASDIYNAETGILEEITIDDKGEEKVVLKKEKATDIVDFLFVGVDKLFIDAKKGDPVHQDVAKLVKAAGAHYGRTTDDITKNMLGIHYQDENDRQMTGLEPVSVGEVVKIGDPVFNGKAPVDSLVLANALENGYLNPIQKRQIRNLLKGKRGIFGRKSIEKSYKGEKLITQETIINKAFFIRKGSVRIIDEKTGKEIAIAGPGDIVGLSALSEKGVETNATVIAMTNIEYTPVYPGDLTKNVKKILLNTWKNQKHIADSTLFRSLPDNIRTLIASLVMEDSFQPGEDIIKENTTGDFIYILVEGSAQVLKKDEAGEDKYVANVELNDYFGEIALLNQDAVRTATVRAGSEGARIIAIHRGYFDAIYRKYPLVKSVIARTMQDRRIVVSEPAAETAPVKKAGILKPAVVAGLGIFAGILTFLGNVGTSVAAEIVMRGSQVLAVVKPGNSLWRIARQYLEGIGIDSPTNQQIANFVKEIISNNPKVALNPELIQPGQELLMKTVEPVKQAVQTIIDTAGPVAEPLKEQVVGKLTAAVPENLDLVVRDAAENVISAAQSIVEPSGLDNLITMMQTFVNSNYVWLAGAFALVIAGIIALGVWRNYRARKEAVKPAEEPVVSEKREVTEEEMGLPEMLAEMGMKADVIESLLASMSPEDRTGFRQQISSIIEVIEKSSDSDAARALTVRSLNLAVDNPRILPVLGKFFNLAATTPSINEDLIKHLGNLGAVFAFNKTQTGLEINPYIHEVIANTIEIPGVLGTLNTIANIINEYMSEERKPINLSDINNFFAELVGLDNLMNIGAKVLSTGITITDNIGPLVELDAIIELDGNIYIVEIKNADIKRFNNYVVKGTSAKYISKIAKIEKALVSEAGFSQLAGFIGKANVDKIVSQPVNILLAIPQQTALRGLNEDERSLDNVKEVFSGKDKRPIHSIISRLYRLSPEALVWLKGIIGDGVDTAISEWLRTFTNKSPPDIGMLRLPQTYQTVDAKEPIEYKHPYEFSFFISPQFDIFSTYNTDSVADRIISPREIEDIAPKAPAPVAEAAPEEKIPEIGSTRMTPGEIDAAIEEIRNIPLLDSNGNVMRDNIILKLEKYGQLGADMLKDIDGLNAQEFTDYDTEFVRSAAVALRVDIDEKDFVSIEGLAGILSVIAGKAAELIVFNGLVVSEFDPARTVDTGSAMDRLAGVDLPVVSEGNHIGDWKAGMTAFQENFTRYEEVYRQVLRPALFNQLSRMSQIDSGRLQERFHMSAENWAEFVYDFTLAFNFSGIYTGDTVNEPVLLSAFAGVYHGYTGSYTRDYHNWVDDMVKMGVSDRDAMRIVDEMAQEASVEKTRAFDTSAGDFAVKWDEMAAREPAVTTTGGNIWQRLISSVKRIPENFSEKSLLAAQLGIEELRTGEKTSYADGVLTINQATYRKIIELLDRSKDMNITVNVLRAMIAGYSSQNLHLTEYLEDYMEELAPHMTDIEAIALPIWFNTVFSFNKVKAGEEEISQFVALVMNLPEGQEMPEKALRIIEEVGRINMKFLGQKQIEDVPTSAGMVEVTEEKTLELKLKSGVRQLVMAISRLGKAVVTMPVTIVEMGLSGNKRWDAVAAAAFMGGGRVSILDLLDRHMRILTGRQLEPDESIIPNLNKVAGVFTAT
ncbi:MAG: cyclic nucleotide-binding domain-containing protein [Elusimicrobiota bacterium]